MVTRIRGRRLQVILRAHLADNPLCVECSKLGLVRAGDEVDHIVALANGGEETESNRQTLCHEHHRDKTARDTGKRVRVAVGADGWPV